MDERAIRRPDRPEFPGLLLKWAAPCLLVSMALCAGCDAPQPPANGGLPSHDTKPVTDAEPSPVKAVEPSLATPVGGFAPVEITILPLTELVQPAAGRGQELSVYVSLADAFGCQMKAPGTFRIELYDYVQRSAAPKGQRIAIWPDVDLTSPAENQKYWRDFLRAYEFVVPAQISPDKTYVLEVTCLIPAGRRLSAEWLLRPGN